MSSARKPSLYSMSSKNHDSTRRLTRLMLESLRSQHQKEQEEEKELPPLKRKKIAPQALVIQKPKPLTKHEMLAKVLTLSTKVIPTSQFHEIRFHTYEDKWESTTVKKILALDIDDTMIDSKETKKQKQIVFVPKLLSLFENISDDVLIVAVTGRGVFELLNNPFNAAITVIREIEKLCGKHIFSALFFTSARSKFPVIDCLRERHSSDDNSLSLTDILIADDLTQYLDECTEEGYRTILATSDGAHFDRIREEFLIAPAPHISPRLS